MLNYSVAELRFTMTFEIVYAMLWFKPSNMINPYPKE